MIGCLKSESVMWIGSPMMEGAIPRQRRCAPSPRSSRGEGWGEGLSRVARLAESVRRVGKAAGSRECANRWRAHQFKNHLKQEVGNGAKSAFAHPYESTQEPGSPVSGPVLTGLNREKVWSFGDTTFPTGCIAMLSGGCRSTRHHFAPVAWRGRSFAR